MNKTFLLAWLLVFVAWMIGSFVVHGMLLQSDYAALASLFRSPAEAQAYFPLMIGAHIFMAGAFTWIYGRGAESRPWLGQGLRFGLLVALLTVVPTYTIYFVVQPMPGMLAIKQMIFDGILLLILGAIAAWCYRYGGRR